MQGGLNDVQLQADAAQRRFIEQRNNLTVVQGGNNGDNQQSQQAQASQQQAETNEALNRAAKALESTAPFIQQAAAAASIPSTGTN